MSKMTFKQFLMEVDIGDIQLAQQAREKEAAAAEERAARGAFQAKAKATFPDRGDVIRTKKGDFVFAGSDRENVYLQQLGGERKRQGFPHGAFKFKATGQKTEGGKPIYTVTK